MEQNNNFNLDKDFQFEEGIPFRGRDSPRNDSIGNNSGGYRSERDEDFDLMDDQYEKKVELKMEIQEKNKDFEEGEVIEIGPQNNPAFNSKNKQPEISLYDIESHLSSKNIAILNFKKTLETIYQYLNAFQLDELTKFIKLIMDLPVFDETFENQKRQNQKIEIENNQLDGVSSDLSAKNHFRYQLPPCGIQTIFEIVSFMTGLVEKCTQLENSHLIPLLKEILNTESRFYNLPLKPEELISENSEFVQNSNHEQKYQQIQEDIQNSYVALFQFSDEVNSLKQLMYYYFSSRCINSCFKKDSVTHKLSTKMKIHCIKILNELSQTSPEIFIKFKFNHEQDNYVVSDKTEILKMQKQELQDYSNAIFDFCHKDSSKIALYLSFLISTLVNDQNSIQKKSFALKLVDKLILNTKLYTETIDTVSQILEDHSIVEYFLKDQTHSQLLRKLPPIVKFLYQLQKIQITFVKKLVKDAIKGHEEFFKVVQSVLQYLKFKHLDQVFHFIQHLITKESDVRNLHVVGLIQSIVSNTFLASNRRKKKHTSKKETHLIKAQHGLAWHEMNQTNPNSSMEEHPLVYEIFGFLFNLVQEPKFQYLYVPILCRHISLQTSLLLPLLEQELTSKLVKPKNYQSFVISILDHCLKIDLDSAFTDQNEKKKIVEQKQESTKYQFINNLVTNCNLYDSIIVMLCKKRFDKNITQKCLNILILVTKSFKPLEKGHIELLWKILGLHSTNQFEKQQFFQFIKQILKNSINLSEQSVKYIYFEIILKLHYDWFTPKIYDCFEMLFMRLNEDGKLLTYENQNNNNQNPTYHLNRTQLVGLEKFYYLYFWAQQKVSKKVKDFLFKLYSYKSSVQIKLKMAEEYIQAIMRYIRRSQQSEDRVLHAHKKEDLEQHVNRAFQLISKFLDGTFKSNGEQNAQQNIISLNIHNATREALPPVKKTIEVNKNMLLKDFKDLIRKQMNPQISDIELINKGKPLKVQKMSLKQLKIENRNTIFIENLDFPVPKKQIEEKKLNQCKQTLQAIFGEQHPMELLNYVAEKYLGEQLQKICQWIMDEEKMKQIQSELKNKNAAKIQQQKQIVPKKMYQNQPCALSFGEIISKQIQVLVDSINSDQEQSHQTSIEKQWTVIRKIPANLQIAKKIQLELQSTLINFRNIFLINQNGSLNFESYIWFLMRKMISKKDEQSKRNLLFDKNLETFLVDRLQSLIHNQVYNLQLYQQILHTHQLILLQKVSKSESKNEVNSIFSLLMEQQSNKEKDKYQFSPTNALSEAQMIIKKCRLQFQGTLIVPFKDRLGTYKHLIKLLIGFSVNYQIAQKILGYLLFNLTHSQNMDLAYISQNLESYFVNRQQLYFLILRYKNAFLKFYFGVCFIDSSRLDKQSEKTHEQVSVYKENYINLRQFIFKTQSRVIEASSAKGTKQWLYFLLIGLIDLIRSSQSTSIIERSSIFEQDLERWITTLIENHLNIQKNEVIGILALINKLTQKILNRNYHNVSNFVASNFNLLVKFIYFLTKDFIFEFNRVPILTDKIIKEQYYQILIILAESNNELLIKIAEIVIKFGVQKRNHDHDIIDFRKNDFVGIQNLGCTCYINSLIQQLYHTRLPYKLLALTKQQGLFQLNHTFMQLYMSTKNAINIRPMIQQVKFYGQQIIPTIQQDVEEFLISLLDYIESCNGRSIIDSIFGGSYSEELTYFSEREEGKVFKKHKQEHFYNITLDIKGKRTLNEALVYFFRSQTLDDKIFCEELEQKTSVVKRSFIKHFPKILIFTLKRFEFDVQNMVRNKLNDYLEFPMDLDLSQFSLDKFLSDQQNKNKVEVEKCSQEESHFYGLCGILIHSGSAEAGHYYSYIQRENKWFEFNDRIVTQINLLEKIKGECFGGGDSKSRNAYMLFYQKIQSKTEQPNSQIQKVEKMEIEERESAMDEQLEKTIPLEEDQGHFKHHGIFLSQIPQNNYFKQLVRQENHHFIKERLVYDPQYRKFIQNLIVKILEAKKRNPNETDLNRQEEYLLSSKFIEIEKINEIINPKVQKPVVYFVSNQMMENEGSAMKEISYEEQEKLNQERRKKQKQTDIAAEIFQENQYDNFI